MANFFTELIEKTDLEELNANSNGVYLPTKEGFSKVTVGVPNPIEVSTEAEMTALLESGEVGGIYKYVGESTDAYENGGLYVLEGDALQGTWLLNDTIIAPTASYMFYLDGSYFGLYGVRENMVGNISLKKINFYTTTISFANKTNNSNPYSLTSYGFSTSLYRLFYRQTDTKSLAIEVDASSSYYDDVRLITINTNVSDVVDGDGNPNGDILLTWLQANATKTVSVNKFTKLIPQTDLEELTATSNGDYTTEEGYSKVTVSVPIPQLVAPTLSIADNTLTITDTSNGAFATSYDLYIDGSLSGNYTSTTIDLTTLELAEGTYSITAIAKGTNFVDSAESEAVSYDVA